MKDRATKEIVAGGFSLDALSEAELDDLTRLIRKLRLAWGDFTE